ncbi:3-oxoadipate enol-lactonase [Lentzea sp. BCCO 10_0856]|uniref:3-oxoadipate enol-lactonase n=1 Tax=Lentzea miocenica TaxID=3095431 RepID=A0ABU4TBU0_9PSEU|nr:3-oxoadipate enol-lactonase [Lentzea sp. BCCO 10_0856]MDX8035397.1 3-oxoadipate enol-lactonase [Lentzea sp. BCCO 10_0856]
MSVAEVHHVVTGRQDGPVVVLSNSLGSTLEMWDANVAALEEHFRVVRYDTRGHGRSPVVPGPHTIDALAGDLVVLLNRLNVEKAHLVGLSLGGMTALRLAARNPERVDRLAVLCTSAQLGPAANWTGRAALVRAQGTAAVAEAVVQRWFTPAHQDRARWEAMVAATPAEGYAGCCEAIAAMDLRADLARITAPTLAIAGADDPATPPHHLEQIVASIRDATLLVVPGAAHLANAEQPGVVTAALVDHLTKESSS